ncbi:Gfo/Idh/MocA family protein [Stieleria marina]|uniref:Putative oxidoreductase YhhX n=1 Tax=Stieleria marina TaxID=1930275 RepID=A0A517NNT9_9BACT|nr:putative oxidoreductase YhhX [Planctomycetes bacterium K23_9]
MNIALIGCGYVADFYLQTLPNHPQLNFLGAHDAIAERSSELCKHFGGHHYQSIDEVLCDDRVDAVINLTNPRSHFEISAAALDAGKHVYSEKPLATDLGQAAELVDMAKSRRLQLSSAPCNVLSETAQTAWQALRNNAIGTVRLAYAEMDDGLIHQMPYDQWKSILGRPWPVKDELEVGCTLEHAGYYLTWLVAFFGSVTRLTTFPRCLIPSKNTRETIDVMAPDFSVACLEFESGVVARLTCSIIAQHDHHLKIYGDDGTLSVEDCWYYNSPVYVEPFSTMSARMKKIPLMARIKGVHRRKLPPLAGPGFGHCYGTGGHHMDFSRGIADLAKAVQDGQECHLSADFSLHINEVVLKIQTPTEGLATQNIDTRAGSISPMPWAQKIDSGRAREQFEETIRDPLTPAIVS